MKIAVAGSRDLVVSEEQLKEHLGGADEIVSGGARGIDMCAWEFARKSGIKLVEFLPEYQLYGRAAPIVRNKKIVDYADKVIVFWNGKSNGTKSVIEYARKTGKVCEIIFLLN